MCESTPAYHLSKEQAKLLVERSSKLAKLSENGMIQKTFESASPPYTRYSLTEKGIDLVFAFRAMADWSLKWQNQASNGT